MKHIQTGKSGEAKAYHFLKKKKYKILETNYINKIGEIDIICKDNDELVFVEVKTRTSQKFGLPREAVTEYKQQKIKNVATLYLQQRSLLDAKIRFDVVEILDDEITHLIRCY